MSEPANPAHAGPQLDADPPGDSPPNWPRITEALTRHLLACEADAASDILTACDGDAALAAQVRTVLAGAPPFLAHAPTQVPPLRVLGDFELLTPLGSGGMGTVYLARQRSLGRLVALKVIDQHTLQAPGARVRFRREAELAAALEHPNIVPIYAVGEIDGSPYLAMKRLSGPSLGELATALTATAAARIGVAIANALDAAHVLGVVHRDVKPHNIILDGDTPYVVDFGLARAHADSTLTQAGSVPGTLRYMAPERLESEAAGADPRVDVYGLGVTLYELVANTPAFAEDSAASLLHAILTQEPPPLRLRGRDRDFATIVARAMAKEPARRFATAAALAADLERFLREEPIASRPISLGERAVRQIRRNRIAAAVVTLALMIASVIGARAWLAERRHREDRDRRLQTVTAASQALDWPSAGRELDLLAQSDPTDPEVVRLAPTVRAEQALTELILQIANRPTNLRATAVEELVHRVQSGSLSPARQGLGELTAIAATAHLAGALAASERLDRLPTQPDLARARAAIDSWLRRWAGRARPDDWQHLPGQPGSSTIEATALTIVAMRMAGRPGDEALRELEPWHRRPPVPLLLRYMHAAVLLDAGDNVAAMVLLRSLVHEPAGAPHTWLALAEAALRLDRVDEARAAFAHAGTPDGGSAGHIAIQLAHRTARTTGDRDGLLRHLAELTGTNRHCDVRRIAAELRGKIDPTQRGAVVAELRGLLHEQTHDVLGRELTLLAALEVAAIDLPDPWTATAEQRQRHRDFAAEHMPEVEAMLLPGLRAQALTWLARSWCACEATGSTAESIVRGLDLFVRVTGAPDATPPAAVEFAEATWRHCHGLPEPLLGSYVSAALDAVRAVIRRHDAGALALVGQELERALHAAWRLSAVLDDAVGVAHWCARLDAVMEQETATRAEARTQGAAAAARAATARTSVSGR